MELYNQFLEWRKSFDLFIEKEYPDSEFKKKRNYYKGRLNPFVRFVCRPDMTTGDIDFIQWDFKKNKLRIIECKTCNENQKESQNKLLDFLASNLELKNKEYKLEIFKMIGDEPFEIVKLINLQTKEIINYNQEEFIKFINME
jgi:hypothetical protein